MGLAHPYTPVSYRSPLVVDYLERSPDSRVLRHLLTVDYSTMAGTVLAAKEYLAVRSSDRPAYKDRNRRNRDLANSHSCAV